MSTYEWGNTHITSLNNVFNEIVKEIMDYNSKVSAELSTFKTELLQSIKCANDKTQQDIHENGRTRTCFKREELVDIMLHLIADILGGTL